MIVSALLTSVGINSTLCILFFTLYSIIRKQPGYFYVFVPRLLVEKGIESSHYIFQRLLPSPDWLKRAWELSEEELLSISGLDAVVLIRTIILSLKIFSFAGVVGLFVLLPINCSGTELAAFDFTIFSSETLDVFTISNLKDGSKWLWVHCAAVYLITGIVCYLLYHEYDYISSKRIEYFYASKPQPHQFTILVREIPVPPGKSISEIVDDFFKKHYGSTYLSHMVIHRKSKLFNSVNEVKKLYRRLRHIKSEFDEEYSTSDDGFDFSFCQSNDENLEENPRTENLDAFISGKVHEIRCAFVFFKSRFGAAIASRFQQSDKPTEWVTDQAPEPNDVYWPYFRSTFLKRWMSILVIIVVSILLTALFLIPVMIVQSLANLSLLESWFPILETILSSTGLSQIVTGYLPNLILQLFVKLVPPVMEFLSSIQGYISYSAIQRSACDKFLWFIIWNIFFANVLSGSLFKMFSVLLDLQNIPSQLAVAVPAQASFFIAFVVTSGWTSTSSDLFRIIQIIQRLIQNCCCCKTSTPDKFELPYILYHREIPKVLLFVLLGITYFFLAPLILPFLLIYFFLAYIIYKNQFINVYAPKFETGGKFWPTVHNCIIFSLVLMHAIALGIFTTKKVQCASFIMIPLPLFTLLFNEFCRKRFLPNFSAYSTESLIRKDTEDLHDPQMGQFFDELVTVYTDPTLSHLNFSNSNHHKVSNPSDISDDHITPLLSHT